MLQVDISLLLRMRVCMSIKKMELSDEVLVGLEASGALSIDSFRSIVEYCVESVVTRADINGIVCCERMCIVNVCS